MRWTLFWIVAGAATLFWLAAAGMVAGFAGHDLLPADGVRHYGTSGLVFSCILIAIEALFALYAGWAARQGMLKRP